MSIGKTRTLFLVFCNNVKYLIVFDVIGKIKNIIFPIRRFNYHIIETFNVIKEIDFIPAPRVIEVSLGNDRRTLGDPRVVPWTALDRATGTIPEKLALLRFLASTPRENQSVEDALNTKVQWDERKLQIVGVVKNYHHTGLQRAIEPIIFYPQSNSAYFTVRLSSDKIPAFERTASK